MSDREELKNDFWKSLADSPFVFLQRDAAPEDAIPMTTQLDKDADSAIWFFTTKDNSLAQGGAATVTFASKGHDMFARIKGTLSEEHSRERLEKQWSKPVEAWYEGGKDDPNLLMLRMDLGKAEIWGDLGTVDTVKMLLGFDVRDDAKEENIETVL